MTCELRLLSDILDLEKCRRYLFGEEIQNNSNWLQKCVVAISPLSDRLVIAHDSALIVLTTQWNQEKEASTLRVSGQWNLQDSSTYKDTITSACILPVVGSSSQTVPDWTCIAVGFSSGNLRFFTENLDVLSVVQLHGERILNIKATGRSNRHDSRAEGLEPPEALIVVHPSVICNIPGFSLFQTLRGCRSEVALKRARSDNTPPKISLDYKKYGFSETPVRDACIIRSSVINNFDYLLGVTLDEGYYKNYRPSPPQQTLFVSTGPSSWCRFDHSTEGVAPPLELADVAITVINKLPGWLGLSTSKSSEPPPKPTEKLSLRYLLLDRRREGKSVTCSPDGSHVAVVDALGRVTLVEAKSGQAVRLFKGYRDAECGFLEIEEEIPKSRHRSRREQAAAPAAPGKITLLVIYAPKKGLVEVFPLRYGSRVAALHVSKNGRLLYVPHGLLGQTGGKVSRKSGLGSSHLVFVAEDGLLDLCIPFHCALQDSSARTKDMHLLKQMKQALKGVSQNSETLSSVVATAKQLETDDVRLMALDFLITLKNITPEVINAVIDVFLQQTEDKDVEKPSGGHRNVVSVCKQLRNIVRFYSSIQEIPDGSEDHDEENTPLAEVLFISESEISVLLDRVGGMYGQKSKSESRGVTFHEQPRGQLSKFLQCLDLADTGPITHHPKLKDEDCRSYGEILFARLSRSLGHIENWKNEARLSDISPSFIAKSLVMFYLHSPLDDADLRMRSLVRLLLAVSSLSEEPVTPPDFNAESCWWAELRSVIAKSNNSVTALTTALCCRAASLVCEQQTELLGAANPKDAKTCIDWENVSGDTWQWDLLISQLEDVMVLNAVLSWKCRASNALPCDISEVSLADLKTRGPAAVSELTAKWLCQFQIAPSLLIDPTDVEFRKTPVDSPVEKPQSRNFFRNNELLMFPLVEEGEVALVDETSLERSVIEKVRSLKKSFPMSVTSSVLLTHVGWELMNHWQQDLSNVKVMALAVDYFLNIPSAHLKAGISSLAWSTFIKSHFEAITRLVTKMGKLPTDTLCSREIGIPRGKIQEVLKTASRFLQGILDACSERPIVPFAWHPDDFWSGHSGSRDLISVTFSRPATCEDVVLLHHQMATVLHMVVALEMRDKAVLSALFNSVKVDLFGELVTRRTIVMHHPGLSDALLSFLRRAVSAAVQTVREVEGENSSKQVEALDAYQWIRVCFDLATTWRLPLDSLRRQQVCELYSAGYDRLAEETLPAVSSAELLASQLLVVVGKRIKALISSSSTPQHVIADISPSLTSWINSLGEDDLKENRSSLEDTATLIRYVLLYLPQSHMDADIARRMEECIQALQNS